MKKLWQFLLLATILVGPLLAQVTGSVSTRFPIKKLVFGLNLENHPLGANAVYVAGLPDTMPAVVVEVLGVDTFTSGGSLKSVVTTTSWLDGGIVRYSRTDTFQANSQIHLPTRATAAFGDSLFLVVVDTIFKGSKFQVMTRVFGTMVTNTVFDTLETK